MENKDKMISESLQTQAQEAPSETSGGADNTQVSSENIEPSAAEAPVQSAQEGAAEPEGAEKPEGTEKPESAEETEESETVPIVFDEDFDANSEEYAAELEKMKNNLAADVEEQPRYQKPKLPFKEAVENFLYHNKTKLIVLAVTLIMGSIIIYQSIPEKYDYTFMIFSSNYYFDDISLAAISDNLEQYGEDLDGDGEVKVHTMRFDINSEDYNESTASRMYMAEEFRTQHEAYLVITDKAHFDVLTNEEEGFGMSLFENYKGLGEWIDVTDSGLFVQTDGAFNIKDGDDRIGLSLVALNDNTRGKEKYEKRYENAKALLDRLLEDHPELN